MRSSRLPAGIISRRAESGASSAIPIQIRDFRKRWGSGGSHGRLAFNWRILAPRRLVEYVIAHELCHVRHPDHSRDFWRLLERLLPDYDRRRTELAIKGRAFDVGGKGLS